MDTEHPDIQSALGMEEVNGNSGTRFDLFRIAILHVLATPNSKEKDEILEDIEKDLSYKEQRTKEITMQQRLQLVMLLRGKNGVNYRAMGS